MNDYLLSLLTTSALIFLAAIITRLILKCAIKRCESTVSMKGKVIIVTGANTGLGFHVAKDLAARGGRVILACRNIQRGTTARDDIIASTGNMEVVFKQLNLSSLKSVRQFAEDVKKTESRLDVLVNNAGVYGLGDRLTEDNIVEGMQINHFAPFLLTILLLPMLKESQGRIVNLSSLCHYRGEVKIDKINKPNAYSGISTYANGKLCAIIFTKELARRLGDSKVTVNAVHPGVILTNIASNGSFASSVIFAVWCWLCCRTADEGAQTIIYLSVADEVKNTTGKYFVDCKERFVLWSANNEQLGKQLWEFSEQLVGLKKEEKPVFLF
ncbi:short chain dehydrogenase domain-containing protein [Phthorimaea operculella]|nr:short chain dehydrogenase domain-containing protein [Phthorimaea operculella]